MKVGRGGVTQPVVIARALAAALRAESVEAIFRAASASPSSAIDDVRTRVGEGFGSVARDTRFHRFGLLDVAPPPPDRSDGAKLQPGVPRIATRSEAEANVRHAVPDRRRSAR